MGYSSDEQVAEVQLTESQLYNYAAGLLIQEKRDSFFVKDALIARGLSNREAARIVDSIEDEIQGAIKGGAKKDMIYGLLWCVGGTVLTLSNVGFIFWGAIVFGAIQFFKGLYTYLTN